MDKFHYLKVTHAALDHALRELGFRVSQHETYRLYENKEHGTLLMLPPDIPMSHWVRPAHLSSARQAVVAFGVADQATLEKLLTDSAPDEQVPAPATAPNDATHRRRPHRTSISPPAVPAEAH